MKTCTKCNIEKPFEAFYKQSASKDGYFTECKECGKARHLELKKSPLKQLEKQIRSSIILENKLLAREGKKLCTKCKDIFLIEDIISGGRCKNCEIEHRKEYYEKNKDKRKEIQKECMKEYWLKNKDKIKEHQRKYRLKKKLEKENHI